MASKKKTSKKTARKNGNNVAKDKRAKFEELARKRMTKALKAIRQIGNLSNRANYDYTQDHVNKMLTALANEVKAVQSRFTEKEKGAESGFDFS